MSSTSTTDSSQPYMGDPMVLAVVPQRVMQAWADQDAEAFASLFTEDGTMILPGQLQKGRENIRAFMSAAFAGPYQGTQVVGHPVDVRFLSPDAGLLLTEGGVRPAGEAEVPPDRMVRGSWLVVKRDGRWQLAAYQNTPRDSQ